MKDNELNEQEERDTKNPKPDRETALQAELNELKTQLDDLRDSGPPDSGSDVPPRHRRGNGGKRVDSG